MKLVVVWEAVAGGIALLAGAVMAASPMLFLKLLAASPALAVTLRPWPSGNREEHLKKWRSWRLRTRLLGGCLLLIGVVALADAFRGGDQQALPPSPPYVPGF